MAAPDNRDFRLRGPRFRLNRLAIGVGVALTGAGVIPAPPAAMADPPAIVAPAPRREETTAPPLVLKLDNPPIVIAGHSSHSSHASHASHYSGSSAPLTPLPSTPTYPAPSPAPVLPPAPARVSVPFSSSPSAADIQIDSEFVGSTPSTLRVSVGAHTILITKVGYLPWSRRINVSADSQITVHADLTPIPPPSKK